MDRLAIITGANRGLGKELADLILQEGNTMVVSLSRSVHPDHLSLGPDKFLFIETDLSKPFNATLLEPVKDAAGISCVYFFNNAGNIWPLERVGVFSNEDIANSIAINVTYPVSLTNYIIGSFGQNGLNLVNITSGAGNRPIANWAAYCAAKAYMLMFFKTIEQENAGNTNFKVYSIDPGTMDTGMQQQIRNSNAPGKDYFTSLKDNNQLIAPIDAARKILTGINFQSA